MKVIAVLILIISASYVFSNVINNADSDEEFVDSSEEIVGRIGKTEKPEPTKPSRKTEKPEHTRVSGKTEKPEPTRVSRKTEKPEPTRVSGKTEKPTKPRIIF